MTRFVHKLNYAEGVSREESFGARRLSTKRTWLRNWSHPTGRPRWRA